MTVESGRKTEARHVTILRIPAETLEKPAHQKTTSSAAEHTRAQPKTRPEHTTHAYLITRAQHMTRDLEQRLREGEGGDGGGRFAVDAQDAVSLSQTWMRCEGGQRMRCKGGQRMRSEGGQRIGTQGRWARGGRGGEQERKGVCERAGVCV
eukprot:2514642-Rhodomonas_salina.1